MIHSMEQAEAYFLERRKLGIKPGLERMYAILASQNNPHQHLKAVHIAGTNGKGSTLTYIKAALMENDYRVGVFTSPSLTGLTGHMLINDRPIEEELFLEHLNRLLPAIHQLDAQGLHLTEFEIITTIAFIYFSNHVDIAIIEAGMGGREDSTNVVNPIVSIITNIAKDHASFLGNTIEEIACHKAGIIKENRPVVIGEISPSTIAIMDAEAKRKNSPRYQLHKDFAYETTFISENSQRFQWIYDNLTYSIEIRMRGNHQAKNGATAMMALFLINKNGFLLDWNKVTHAIQNAQSPGRFEQVNDAPKIILDGAHNPNGMEAFLHTVKQLYSNKHKHLIFAGFKDKELRKMLQMALPYFDTIRISNFDHPRAEDAKGLAKAVHSEKVDIVDWQNELNKLMDEDSVYFFAGSLHFIGIVRNYIQKQRL